jgi:hypothetical protein
MDKLSCRKATFLSVKKSEEGLSLSENITLSYHNRLCKVCKFWDDQSRLIDFFLKKNIEDPSSRPLTPGEKEHIKSKVKQMRSH